MANLEQTIEVIFAGKDRFSAIFDSTVQSVAEPLAGVADLGTKLDTVLSDVEKRDSEKSERRGRMRAYILTLNNMYSMDELFEDKPVSAAFLNLEDVVNQLGDELEEMAKDFEQKRHFEETDDARITMTIDVVNISEEEFNQINSAKRTGKFFVAYRPDMGSRVASARIMFRP